MLDRVREAVSQGGDPLRRVIRNPVTVWVSETTLTVELDDADPKIVRRTTTKPVRSIKGQRPRTATSVS